MKTGCAKYSYQKYFRIQMYDTISVDTFNNRPMYPKWKQAKVTFYCFKGIHVKADVT